MYAGLRAGLATVALALATAAPAAAQITEPPSTEGCIATGGGTFRTISNGKATFGLTAAERNVIGRQEYVDHGPPDEFRFHARNTLVLICTPIPGGLQADIFGVGRVDTGPGTPSQVVQYRITVRDGGEGMGTGEGLDTYHISLSNGYDSTERPLLGGNIVIRMP